MKLATFRAPGDSQPRAGAVEEDRVRAFADGVTVTDVLGGHVPAPTEDAYALSEVVLLAPVPRPGTVYAIGLNYARHVEETGGQRPEQPIVFVKVAASLTGPAGPVRCPQVVRRLDYEGELTIVMGAVLIAGFRLSTQMRANITALQAASVLQTYPAAMTQQLSSLRDRLEVAAWRSKH